MTGDQRSAKIDPGRLDGSTRPVHYTVELVPEPESASFTGSVAIELEVLEARDSITLHALDLSFDRVSLRSGSGDEVPGSAVFDTDHETARIQFDRIAEAMFGGKLESTKGESA